MHKRMLLLFILVVLIVACGNQANATNRQNGNITLASSTPAGSPSAAGTSSPTATSTPTAPSARSTPSGEAPTPSKSTSYHSCTAANCSNPWNFVLGCACGAMWQPVDIAPSGFCSWFHCIPNFGNESGDIGECGDGEFSHAGGLSGMCRGHNGLLAYLYKYVPPTPTPKPTQKPTPTPSPIPTPTPAVTPTPVI